MAESSWPSRSRVMGLSSGSSSRATYTDLGHFPYGDWLLDGARKAGDITVIENGSGSSYYYYVIRFEGRELDQEQTHTVRHLLVRAGQASISATPTQEEYDAAEEKAQSLLEAHTPVRKDLSIVYSPLNGAGLEPVLRVLKESGYRDITVVKEQAQPDGTFPTCPYPNPEESKAMALGLCYARACQADLLLATDPDCDRVGIAAKGSDGRYVLLSANETGLLLLDYIASRRTAMGTMPKDPLLFKTIVTTDLARSVAAHYGMETVDVLTGFKFIGEQIGLLEAAGALDRYVFGFEESYGYLSGTYVRDKDGVGATFLICEMAAFYAAKGISLPEKLEALYRTYGYCLDTQHPYTFAGAAGAERMGQIMGRLREGIGQVGPRRVLSCTDYRKGIDGLPAADVLRFRLDEDCSLVVRPSGTEPKLKMYLSVRGGTASEAQAMLDELSVSAEKLMENEV